MFYAAGLLLIFCLAMILMAAYNAGKMVEENKDQSFYLVRAVITSLLALLAMNAAAACFIVNFIINK